MICPNCSKKDFSRFDLKGIKTDKCNNCQGIWFDEDELRKAKDNQDEYLAWLDVDLWKDEDKLSAHQSPRICPKCQINIFTIKYGDSNIEIDVCNKCQGVWLDKGEFDKIITYLNNVVNTESLNKYLKHTIEEAGEIITGPDGLKSEFKDFLIVSRLLQYRLLVQHPYIGNIIALLPR